MNEQNILEKSYLSFIEFLLLSKHSLIEIGSKHGLTAMQSITLILLSEPRTMQSYTRTFNCDASNITGIAEGLVQKDLIKRYEDKEDRRLKIIETTSKGKEIRNQILNNLTNEDSFIMKKLSFEEASTFVSLLQKIIN